MKQNKEISQPVKSGMNREVHPSLVQPSETSFCLNCNSETSTGDRPFITNEPSNILDARFPEGFKVIGYKYYMQNERTYYFLTNPQTKLSSFGFIETTQNYTQEEDTQQECEDCSSYNELGTPLEQLTQQVIHTYTELLNDSCNGAFNFNINYPIKTIEVKNEKVGLQIYFTDNLNPPRYIKLDALETYTEQLIPCEDGTVQVCLNVDLMRIFPNYSIPQITPAVIQLGGNLKLGTYEFLIAYCDILGNEISEYYSITNPVSIFDQNNRTLTQPDLDAQTNYAIRLNVTGLDLTYPYYKVAVIQRTDVQQTQSYFIEGIHNTSDTTITYISENNKQRTTLANLLSIRTRYEKTKGLVSSNAYLFQYGTTSKKEVNLQPVVNLFSQFLKWQTSIAKEDLYKDGVATSIYKGYNRDEVYAFGARFLSKDGSVSRIFPFVGRQANETDLEEVDPTSLDRMSIEANLNTCETTTRTKRWQFYNDAFLSEEFCSNEDIPTNTVEEEITKVCLIEEVATLPPATFSIETGETYDNLEGFIADIIIAGTCAAVTNCDTPVGNPYPFCAYLDKNCYSDVHCTPTFEGCNEPSLTKEELIVRRGSVTGDGPDGKELVTKIEKDFPADYARMKAPVSCNLYLLNSDGTRPHDTDFENAFMRCFDTSSRRAVYQRNQNSSNLTCASSEDIQNLTSINNPSLSYSHFYYGGNTQAELELAQNTEDFGTGWSPKLHKGALWFKGDMTDRKSVLLEISKQLDPSLDDDVADGQNVRMTIYNKCSSSTYAYSKIIDLTRGDLFKLESDASNLIITYIVDPNTQTFATETIAGFTGTSFYVAIDNKIVTENYVLDCAAPTPPIVKYRTAPTDGCFSIVTRDIEYSRVDVSYTSITLDKKETYTSTCQFEVPIVQSCKALPYRQGEFAYWESEETYPDNAELYNSGRLKIRPEDVSNLSENQLARFEGEFTNDIDDDGYYIWLKDDQEKAIPDLRCKPIRHFKMPDNKIAPFMWSTTLAPFATSIIFPLAVSIDENIINTFLDIAVSNDLLTQQEREEIVSYEIVRSDRIGNKSVIASGYLYDMRLWGETLYANYPYNDLGGDKLNQVDFNGFQNHNFTFHSPETDFEKIVIPSELKVEGHAFGRSRGNFVEVQNHPKWVILGAKAKDLALRLAGLEAAADLSAEAAQSAEAYQLGFGFVEIFNVAGIVLGVIAGVTGALSTVVDIGRYRYEWLQIFRNLGSPRNFAYYYTSEGFYNYLRPIQEEGDMVRGINVGKNLREGTFKTINEVNGEKIYINNKKRERSVFLSLGREFPLTWQEEYVTYDNNKIDSSVSSLSFAGELGDCYDGQGVELLKNIASPYVKLKNYVADQYGTIGSVNWISTGYKGDLLNPQSSCISVFGGDMFISRYELKRKMSIFSEDAMDVASLTPFDYKPYTNIGGNPLFWCDYEVGSDKNIESLVFPDINSNYNFDCQAGTRDLYVKSASKFYLYYYGIPNILCETEINTNFRYGGLEPKDSFASNVGDIIEWTQEKNVSIGEIEKFQYNNVYSRPVTRTTFDTRLWPDNYNSEIEDKKRIADNNVIYSLQDNSENDSFDPWLIYRALDKYEFPKKYGKLVHLKDLESATILGRFENQQVLFNAIDTLSNQQSQITIETGNAGIFQKRPLEFKSTDLGFAGTQHTDMVSTPYGHYTVDAMRGKIFQLDQTGRDLQPISDFIGKDSSGMKNWFKEQLPFKILKQFPQIEVDNKFKGIGISMGWDARFDRVFITKKDYIAVNTECLKYTQDIGFYTDCETSCNNGIDVVFVIDATGSQEGSIDNIKDSISDTIVPALIENFGESYRLALITVKDRRVSGQSLFDIVEPMTIGNLTTFQTGLDTVVADGGFNSPEPTDLALRAVLNNTGEIDLNNTPIASLTIGEFRENAAKVVILVTDELPSGLNDNYSLADFNSVNALAEQFGEQKIQIFTFTTAATNPSPIPPEDGLPNLAYIMQNYAQKTNGQSYFTPLGVGITDGIVELIQEGVVCDGNIIPIDFDNTNYFEDVSWTVAYKVTDASWLSYYSFKPEYYIGQNEYFQTGKNYGTEKESLWNHLLKRNSYQVFYGEKFPFTLEIPVKNDNINKMLSNISLEVESRRYTSDWDFSNDMRKGFNQVEISNTTNHSGVVNLKLQKSLTELANYPQTNFAKTEQTILFTALDEKHNFNYLYSRTQNQNNRVPLLLWDKNRIERTVNPISVNFKHTKPTLERLRGESFAIRLTQNETSQFQFIFKNAIILTDVY